MIARLALLLGFVALTLGHAQSARAQGPLLDVVELFTSQGCSSCPPADALLKKTYAGRSDVLALSFSVDYWDYLGWKDTLASPKHTARWRAYATARGDGQVYTPQMVVNGLQHAVGSQAAAIERAIKLSRATLAGQRVTIRATVANRMLTIDIGAVPPGSSSDMATVWLAIVQPQVDVEIRHGENRGKSINYVNVVRELTPVGVWTGAKAHIELPESALMKPGQRCAVLLQVGDAGRILGATWVAEN